MPSITLTFTAAEADRIKLAMAPTDYPPTVAGFKQLLVDYIKSWVKEYERNKLQQEALDAVSRPSEIVVQ